MPKYFDRVMATTTSTGSADLNLGSSLTGYKAFSDVLTDGDQVTVLIIDDPNAATEWEVTHATYNSGSPDTITRGTIISSSNSDARVNFSAGQKNIYVSPMSEFFTDADAAIALINATPRDSMLINGDFLFGQRGTSFTGASSPANNDDAYTFDRWVLISDGNDVVDLSQLLATAGDDLPSGARSGTRATVQTANKQFGLVQIVEAKDCQHVIGAVASLSSQLKLSSGIAKMRAAILAWTGTADAVTSDVVGTWAGGGTEPTWAANWTREGAVAELTTTGSWEALNVLNASIDTASAKQVAVVIWLDDTDASVSDTVDFSNIKLEAGAVVTPHLPRPAEIELALCQRYFQRLTRGSEESWINVLAISSAISRGPLILPVQMRVAPAVSLSGASNFRLYLSTGTKTPSAMSGFFGDAKSGFIRADGSGLTGDQVYELRSHSGVTTFIELDSEL